LLNVEAQKKIRENTNHPEITPIFFVSELNFNFSFLFDRYTWWALIGAIGWRKRPTAREER
jgi:hypothetical protein